MDRGTSYYREIEGPPGAPTLLLLHGWMATGGLNWLRGFEALGEKFRVIAPDLMIVARSRYQRITEAIERAGADHVLAEEEVIGTVLGTTVANAHAPDSITAEEETDDIEESTVDHS